MHTSLCYDITSLHCYHMFHLAICCDNRGRRNFRQQLTLRVWQLVIHIRVTQEVVSESHTSIGKRTATTTYFLVPNFHGFKTIHEKHKNHVLRKCDAIQYLLPVKSCTAFSPIEMEKVMNKLIKQGPSNLKNSPNILDTF